MHFDVIIFIKIGKQLRKLKTLKDCEPICKGAGFLNM